MSNERTKPTNYIENINSTKLARYLVEVTKPNADQYKGQVITTEVTSFLGKGE